MGGFQLFSQKRKGPFDDIGKGRFALGLDQDVPEPEVDETGSIGRSTKSFVEPMDGESKLPFGVGPFFPQIPSSDKTSTFELGQSEEPGKDTEFVGPKASTELERLQNQQHAMDHPVVSKKNRILQAIATMAPTALAGIFGGPGAAAGAAEGTVEGQGQQLAIGEGRRNKILEQIEAEKNRQERLQEHSMTTEAQKARLKAEDARAAATQAENKRYHDLITGSKSETNLANLRAKGFKYDESGNIVPVTREELGPRERAELELKESSNDLAIAKAEVERLKNNPDSPQYQLAVQKLNAQKERTGVALQRLGLSKDIFERETYGTVGGVGIPGGPVDDEGKPIGLKGYNATRPTSAARSKAEQGQVVVEEGDRLKKEILTAGTKVFGPAAGRIANIEVGIGSADPQVRELYTHLKSFAALQPALHGSRGIGMQKEFEDAAGKLQDNPEAALAAIESLMGTARSFVRIGGVSTPNRGPKPSNAATPAREETVKMKAPDGKTWNVPKSKRFTFEKNGYTLATAVGPLLMKAH